MRKHMKLTAYFLALAIFTVYVMLDTFVITRVYGDAGVSGGGQALAEQDAYAADEEDAEEMIVREGTIVFPVEGFIDAEAAPKLEERLDKVLKEADFLVLDLSKLDYISSAGLRVILKAQKTMSAKGGMKVIHVNDNIIEIFEAVGFDEILDIER